MSANRPGVWSGFWLKPWITLSLIVPLTITLSACACLHRGAVSRGGYESVSFAQVSEPAERRYSKEYAEYSEPAETERDTIESELLARPSPPNCAVKEIDVPAAGTDEPGASADPKLLEAARLEIERDCYENAEKSVRQQLERLQNSVRASR